MLPRSVRSNWRTWPKGIPVIFGIHFLWGDGLINDMLYRRHEDLSSDSYSYKICILRAGTRNVSRVRFWHSLSREPASLNETVSSRFSERFVLKNKVVCNWGRHPMSTSGPYLYLYIYWCTGAQARHINIHAHTMYTTIFNSLTSIYSLKFRVWST